MFMLCWVRLAHKSHWAGVVSVLAQWLEEFESLTSFYNTMCPHFLSMEQDSPAWTEGWQYPPNNIFQAY